jgi:hypothetical protein
VKRAILLLALVALLVIGVFGAASAITNGEEDGDGHPYVGLMAAFDADGEYQWRCSGTLLSPTVFLTAGHCTEPPATQAEIWFEADLTQEPWYPTLGQGDVSGVTYTHPQYDPNAFWLYDLGVVVLDEPIYMDEYGELPAVDQLDDLRPRRHTGFTAVGYGLQRVVAYPYPMPHVQADKIRMVAYPHLIQINAPGFTGDFSLLLSNNHSTGGTCFGDSGGPNFIEDTNVIAGVTSFGMNGSCGGTGGVYRVDGFDDLDWLYDEFAVGVPVE